MPSWSFACLPPAAKSQPKKTDLGWLIMNGEQSARWSAIKLRRKLVLQQRGQEEFRHQQRSPLQVEQGPTPVYILIPSQFQLTALQQRITEQKSPQRSVTQRSQTPQLSNHGCHWNQGMGHDPRHISALQQYLARPHATSGQM